MVGGRGGGVTPATTNQHLGTERKEEVESLQYYVGFLRITCVMTLSEGDVTSAQCNTEVTDVTCDFRADVAQQKCCNTIHNY